MGFSSLLTSSTANTTLSSPLSFSSPALSRQISNLKSQRLLSPLAPPPTHSSLVSKKFKRKCYRSSLPRAAASGDPPAKALRRILESPGVHRGPACFDALSAKLVERAGFQFCFMSGRCLILCLTDYFFFSYIRSLMNWVVLLFFIDS